MEKTDTTKAFLEIVEMLIEIFGQEKVFEILNGKINEM